MYKIYADDILIYDSTLEDYKIGKGQITLELNKSGSFVFSVYPEHFYYDSFVRLKTVITVYKSGKIIFRGRILNDVTDYWNNKVITCEGELGFLQDSIIRPFTFNGSPTALFTKFITEHNSQVNDFKKFKIGTITVVDNNDYINRYNTGYDSALNNLNSRCIDSGVGGYFYITHGDDGTDPIPTLNWVADFSKVAPQKIEFGSNLKNYTKTVKAENIATAIIPLGAEIDDGDEETENKRLTIAEVNNGKDYVFDNSAVSLYGWIYKTVEYNDVTVASTLKIKAETDLAEIINQSVTLEVTAIDLHLLNPDIESISIGDYVRTTSGPHNFDMTLLCSKQTIDLLKPENDSFTLGRTYAVFTESNSKIQGTITEMNKTFATKTEVTKKFTATVEATTILLGKTEESILAQVSKTYATSSEIKESLKDYATNEEIGNTLKSYAKTEDVNTAINVAVGKIDFSVYAKTETLKNYATTQVVSDTLKNYATLETLESYAKTEEVESKISTSINGIDFSVYAKTTEVSNTLKDYATTEGVNSTLESYAKTEEVNTAIRLAVEGIDLSVYSKKSEVSDILKGYATTESISAISLKADENASSITQLTEWKRTTTDSIASVTQVVNNHASKITSLTEWKTDTDRTVASIATQASGNTAAINLRVTTEELDNKLKNYATSAELSLKVDKETLISEINAVANKITITSDNFKLSSDGAIQASNIEITGGTISIPTENGAISMDSAGFVVEDSFGLTRLDSSLMYHRNGSNMSYVYQLGFNSDGTLKGTLYGKWRIARGDGNTSKVVTLLDLQNLGLISETTRNDNE